MENENKFEELKAFLGYFYDKYLNQDKTFSPEINPLNVLKGMPPAKARRGLRMAIDDCIEATSTWPPDEVSKCDIALRAQGIMSLSELRQRYSSRVRNVLKRGQIKTDVEYYMLRGIVTEEELAIFDLLTTPEPKLTKAEEAETKRIARQLLHRLHELVSAVDWVRGQETRGAVLSEIRVRLNELPQEPYPKALWQTKVDSVWQFVLNRYA